MSRPDWSALLERLGAASCAEAAAQALVDAAVGLLQGQLDAEGWEPIDATLLRAVLHLRPDFGYAGLMSFPLSPEADPGSGLSSRAVWRALRDHAAGLWVDVQAGWFSTSAGECWRAAGARPDAAFRRTRQQLSARQVTHLGALPLVAPGGHARGMLVLELRCPTLAEEEPLPAWQVCAPTLARMAAVATPYIERTPKAPGPIAVDSGPLPYAGPASASTLRLLSEFVELEEPILLLGESGTGKTELAKWIHQSLLKRGPFVEARLTTVAPRLTLSHLFGSRRGDFSGAENREGAVHRAHGGTLFIDELGRLDHEAQAALLGLLDDGAFHRVGGGPIEHADVRLIAATNLDIEAAIARGDFAEDLAFRLQGAVRLAPLRERPEEVLPFAVRFLGGPDGAAKVTLSASAALLLEAQPWPDNLRGLKFVCRHARVKARRRCDAPTGAELEILPVDVEAALADRKLGVAEISGPIPALRAAGRALVDEARRRVEDGQPPLSRKDLDTLRGFFALAALERLDSTMEVAALLGDDPSVKRSGNHHRDIKAWVAKVEELCEKLGVEGPGDWS
ncbi:MAG: sigma-54-dependent Fis family transcriptional regulator [Alphaproteobacteria bacterium]|nr:sigma-54-dependent Fis family transcriptional regulator [Alphaproteobacteria bacterium]